MCVQQGQEDTLPYVNLYYHKVVVGRTTDDAEPLIYSFYIPRSKILKFNVNFAREYWTFNSTHFSFASLAAGDSGTTNRTCMGSMAVGLPRLLALPEPPLSLALVSGAPPTIEKPQEANSYKNKY